MPLGSQPFDLPINAVKKETSLVTKAIVQSHEDDGTATFFETRIDRRVHTQNVKVKFYIVGYRDVDNDYINLVGRWVELEPYELDFFYPILVPTSTPAFPQTYRIGFYPYVETQGNILVVRLQLVPHPVSSERGELYIEKLTVIDSDFDAEKSWFNDPDLQYPIVPPIDPPDPGPDPVGTDPDPNCVWPF